MEFCKCPVTEDSTEFEYFRLCVDDTLMNIVAQTNNNYKYTLAISCFTEITSSTMELHNCGLNVSLLYNTNVDATPIQIIYKYWSTDRIIARWNHAHWLPSVVALLWLKQSPGRWSALHNTGSDYVAGTKVHWVLLSIPERCHRRVWFYWKVGSPSSNIYQAKDIGFDIKLFVVCDCENGIVLDATVYNRKQTMENTRYMMALWCSCKKHDVDMSR